MSLDNGTYRVISPLKTDRGHFRIVQHTSEDPCVCDSGGQEIYIEHISGSRYTIQYSKGHEMFLGPSNDITLDGTLKSRAEPFEWVIDNIGPGQYKVHAPDRDMYWQIPDDAGNQSKVVLSKSKGSCSEVWVFSWANRDML